MFGEFTGAIRHECILHCSCLLLVTARPTIIGKRKETIEITQGKKLTLTCKSKGDPSPTLDWTKDGGPINYADTAYNLLEDSSLEIYSITKAHQGFYMCTAKNKNSMDTKEIKVTVLSRFHYLEPLLVLLDEFYPLAPSSTTAHQP